MLVLKLSEIVMRKILVNQQIELHRVKKKKRQATIAHLFSLSLLCTHLVQSLLGNASMA